MTEHRLRRAGLTIDAAALFLAWCVVAWLAWLHLRLPPRMASFYAFVTFFAWVIVSHIWVPIRLAAFAIETCSLMRREELALTGIVPRAYLLARLKRPVLRAIAPASTLPVLIWLLSDESMSLELWAALGFLAIASVFLSVAAVLDGMRRLCKSSKPTAGFFLVTFVWCFLSLLGLYIALGMGQLLKELGLPYGRAVPVLLANSSAGLLVFLFFFAVARNYFVFER